MFRLSQLLVEYLLYVQDNLKYTNGVLEHDRCGRSRRYLLAGLRVGVGGASWQG